MADGEIVDISQGKFAVQDAARGSRRRDSGDEQLLLTVDGKQYSISKEDWSYCLSHQGSMRPVAAIG